jgi:hypothetical protein
MKFDEKDPAKRILALEAKIARQRSTIKSRELEMITLKNRMKIYQIWHRQITSDWTPEQWKEFGNNTVCRNPHKDAEP